MRLCADWYKSHILSSLDKIAIHVAPYGKIWYYISWRAIFKMSKHLASTWYKYVVVLEDHSSFEFIKKQFFNNAYAEINIKKKNSVETK